MQRIENPEDGQDPDEIGNARLIVYPDPSFGYINFKVKNLRSVEESALAIVRDQYGKLIHTRDILLDETNTYSMHLSEAIPDGLYYLELLTTTESISSSFIKTH